MGFYGACGKVARVISPNAPTVPCTVVDECQSSDAETAFSRMPAVVHLKYNTIEETRATYLNHLSNQILNMKQLL